MVEVLLEVPWSLPGELVEAEEVESEWDCCAELELHWELSESTRDLELDGQGEDEVVDTDMPELSWSPKKNLEYMMKINEMKHNIQTFCGWSVSGPAWTRSGFGSVLHDLGEQRLPQPRHVEGEVGVVLLRGSLGEAGEELTQLRREVWVLACRSMKRDIVVHN